jgi:hypothetical protein
MKQTSRALNLSEIRMRDVYILPDLASRSTNDPRMAPPYYQDLAHTGYI